MYRAPHCAASASPRSRIGSATHATKARRFARIPCTWCAPACPAPSLAAGPIEDLVVGQIHKLAPAGAAEEFLAVWQTLPLVEQARLLARLVERVDYQVAQQTVAITFRPDSGTTLAEELARFVQETKP